MLKRLFRTCLSILLAFTLLAASPVGMAASMKVTAFAFETTDGHCTMCDKEMPAPSKSGCMQSFCSAPCILTETLTIASAADPIEAVGEAVTPLEWRTKPPVSPA